MSELQDKPKILTSDPKVLHKIKYLQFRRQLIPILIVIFLLVLNIFWPQRLLFYPTLAAFGWYLWERVLWRTKNKIAAPEEGAFVSPVNAKIRSVKKSSDNTIITLSKSIIDVVELRLPYPGLRMESNRNWFFDTPQGQVNLRIQSERIVFFENRNIAGEVIGVLPGSSMLTLYLSPQIKVFVKEGQVVFGGETEIFNLNEADEEPRSILVEEPIEEIIPED
jgi:hypothetical protein